MFNVCSVAIELPLIVDKVIAMMSYSKAHCRFIAPELQPNSDMSMRIGSLAGIAESHLLCVCAFILAMF
jgi:hypothetical protein